jgi:hypothetical protein
MHRFLPVMVLVVLAGCASPTERQTYWDTERATWKVEQDRLHDIYRSWFERGFLEAWAGRSSVIETEGLTGQSTDPDGEWAIHEGHMDGQRAGKKARLAYETEQAEKVKQ